MKLSLGFVFIVSCYFLSALSLAEDAGGEGAATVIPASDFATPPPQPTTKIPPKTTTTTVPPKPKTTTVPPKPKTTTVPPKPKTTTVPPKPKTTTVPPKPKTTTVPPKPKTTTVPPKPKTTTVPPKPKTTTVPPKPKTTTVPPKPTTTTTTTTAPVTTTPSPTPGVVPGTYNLTTGKEKQVCVKAKFGLSIQLRTEKANGTFIVNPNKTRAVGECKDTTVNLTLSFAQGFITLLFNKNVTAKTVSVESLSFELNYPLAKAAAATSYKGNNNSHLFVARVGHSYSCREQSIIMGNGLYLDIIKENIQAFNFSKSNEFGSPDLCAADQPNYNVAIAVGVTLLVLIIIVVVAYLVGRRRRSDGYQSL